jgi:Leucine-rich repeat (LRR) protein
MGDIDMAQDTLESGLEQTNSTVIERALHELFIVNTAPADEPADTADITFVEIAGRSFRSDINELVLRDSRLTDADIQALSAFTNLERLDISGNNINDISAVAYIPTLKRFFAANNTITDVSALAGLPLLEYAGLRGNQIANADALFASESLVYLHLSDNQISNVPSLGRNLQLLYLADNRIDNTSVVANAGLMYFDVSGNQG